MWLCILVYGRIPVYGDASRYAGVPRCMGIHSHILEHPSEWECSPIFVLIMVIEMKIMIVIEMMMIMMIDTLV